MRCKLFLAALLLTVFPVSGGLALTQNTPEIDFGGALYRAVFFPQNQPVSLQVKGLPPEVAARITRFNERNKAFRSHLGTPGGSLAGPELWQLQKSRQVERAIVALLEAQDLEQLASDYAKKAVIYYEWEGRAENPLQEASFAENFLRRQPQTPLKPYLFLFLAQRYRCAAEILSREKKTAPENEVWQKYRHYLTLARQEPDPLIGLIAADLDRQPYLYLKVEKSQTASGPECSEKAIPEPIADPRRWSLHCFALSYGPEAGKPEALEEFHRDIDHDGTPELFIGSAAARGNAGGTYYVFKPEGKNFRYLGSLFLHPRAFAVLPLTAAGRPQMMRYLRLGAETGRLETMVYQGGAFECVKSETINPAGQDRSRYQQLFKEQSPSPQTQPGYPQIAVDEALKLAEDYLKAKQIDTSGRYVSAINLKYDDGSRPYPDGSRHRGLYWYINWAWASPRLGGELSLRIFMDKQIVLERHGP